MHRPISSFFLPCFLLIVGIAATAFSQPEARTAEPSFNVTLNIIAGSNDSSQKTDLPQAFSAVTKQLKGAFGYSSFRLVNTYIGRIGDNGAIKYQSVANNFGADPLERPVFLDWELQGLRSVNAAGGVGGAFQLQAFRFGAKIPVKTSSGIDPSGKPIPAFNYENIGLNVSRMSLAGGRPVLIGTMELPQTSGTMFLVISIDSVEN